MSKMVDIDGMHVSLIREEGYVRCGDSLLCLGDFYPSKEALDRVRNDPILHHNAMNTLEEMVVRKERERRMRR